MDRWLRNLRPALAATALLSVATGLAYPLATWGAASALFPEQASGSLERFDGRVVGSRLIAQEFDGPEWFHPRPSAAGTGWDATSSAGSNAGPLNRIWLDSILPARVAAYRGENRLPAGFRVPATAASASGSGLDPDIALDDALLQVDRVAKTRGIDPETLAGHVRNSATGRWWSSEATRPVNVLELNLGLEKGAGIRRASVRQIPSYGR